MRISDWSSDVCSSDLDADGGDHDRQVVGHADRSDHRIEREDDVDGEDLRDGRGEGGGLATAVPAAVSALDGAVDLRGRLDEQEEDAAQQADVSPGYFQVEDLEQRRVQLGASHEAGVQRQAAA